LFLRQLTTKAHVRLGTKSFHFFAQPYLATNLPRQQSIFHRQTVAKQKMASSDTDDDIILCTRNHSFTLCNNVKNEFTNKQAIAQLQLSVRARKLVARLVKSWTTAVEWSRYRWRHLTL